MTELKKLKLFFKSLNLAFNGALFLLILLAAWILALTIETLILR